MAFKQGRPKCGTKIPKVQGLADYLGQYSREFGPESLTEEFVGRSRILFEATVTSLVLDVRPGDIMLWYGSVGSLSPQPTIVAGVTLTCGDCIWTEKFKPRNYPDTVSVDDIWNRLA